jgi:hypothetical protein
MTSEKAIKIIEDTFTENRANEIITALTGRPSIGDIVRTANGTKGLVLGVHDTMLTVILRNGYIGDIECYVVRKLGRNLKEPLMQLLDGIEEEEE